MDKVYLRKTLKIAFASPLAFSAILVLDIDPGLSFLGPLMVFVVIWLLPDPIGVKQFSLLKLFALLVPLLFGTAGVAGLWGMNSIVLFFFILLAGWAIQTWMPSAIRLGLVATGMFFASNVLNSSAPFTTTVYMLVLLAISSVLGWVVDRLFWPVLDRTGIEGQVRESFRIFQELCDRSFQIADDGVDRTDSSLQTQKVRAANSIRAADKALKTAAMTGSLSQSERDRWERAIALQARLLANLLAASKLLQDNRDNPLLRELEPELSSLGRSLSATFAGLSAVTASQQLAFPEPSARAGFQRWQTRLAAMRAAGITQSFNLVSRLNVGLIEHRLEGLVGDISKCLLWLEGQSEAQPIELLVALEPSG